MKLYVPYKAHFTTLQFTVHVSTLNIQTFHAPLSMVPPNAPRFYIPCSTFSCLTSYAPQLLCSTATMLHTPPGKTQPRNPSVCRACGMGQRRGQTGGMRGRHSQSQKSVSQSFRQSFVLQSPLLINKPLDGEVGREAFL